MKTGTDPLFEVATKKSVTMTVRAGTRPPRTCPIEPGCSLGLSTTVCARCAKVWVQGIHKSRKYDCRCVRAPLVPHGADWEKLRCASKRKKRKKEKTLLVWAEGRKSPQPQEGVNKNGTTLKAAGRWIRALPSIYRLVYRAFYWRLLLLRNPTPINEYFFAGGAMRSSRVSLAPYLNRRR